MWVMEFHLPLEKGILLSLVNANEGFDDLGEGLCGDISFSSSWVLALVWRNSVAGLGIA